MGLHPLSKKVNGVVRGPGVLARFSEFDGLYQRHPNDNGHGKNLAGAHALLGATWAAAGNRAKAIDSQHRSIETVRRMLRIAPHDNRLRTTLGFASVRLASVLFAEGQKTEAINVGREGLEVFRSLAQRPEATPDDQNNYAGLILEIGIPELTDARTALEFAQKATAGLKDPPLPMLDTLAQAYCETGDLPAAIRTAEQALLSHPLREGSSRGLRTELDAKLTEFKAGHCK